MSLTETGSRDWGGGQEKGEFNLNSRRPPTSHGKCSTKNLPNETRGQHGLTEGSSEVPVSLTTCALCLQYFVFTGVLAMVTCAVFLRLNSVLKLAVLLMMIAIYALLTETIYAGLFLSYDNLNHSGE